MSSFELLNRRLAPRSERLPVAEAGQIIVVSVPDGQEAEDFGITSDRNPLRRSTVNTDAVTVRVQPVVEVYDVASVGGVVSAPVLSALDIKPN